MSWMVTKAARAVHVVPIDDLRKHVDTGRSCWCAPRVETIDLQTGAPYPAGGCLVIHHALDGRELVERHGLQ